MDLLRGASKILKISSFTPKYLEAGEDFTDMTKAKNEAGHLAKLFPFASA